jgi:two-component system, OmpR family, phosphate regulon sensor histidine kinase PhoR
MLLFVNGLHYKAQRLYIYTMKKNIRLLLTVCLIAIAGVIVLQFYWIKNYYKTALFDFERETNLAFEDAIKKDFQLRCDTIEQLLVDELMDTSRYLIVSKRAPSTEDVFTHYIINAKNKKDFNNFSSAELRDSLREGDLVYKKNIALIFAQVFRSEDLENHVIHYYTQRLGKFTTVKVKEYGFDTTRFRRSLKHELEIRNIKTGFHFYLASSDSLFNNSSLADSLSKSGQTVSKALPTYKWWAKQEQYVRSIFESPLNYVFTKMKWLLIGSLLLVVLVGFCIWLLLKALFHAKKLATIKNDFINNITHELKTPVATISAAIEALQDFDLDKNKQIKYLSHAKHETQRLSKLIDHILVISLYGNNKILVQPEEIEVEKTILEILENLTIGSVKQVHYQITNQTNIKTINVDKQLFIQALTNVFDNAIKYSESEAYLTITCTTENTSFNITCIDKGEGISVSSMPYIFEKFYREPKANHSIKGHGLGLNYVQEIMKAHKGNIEIKSTKGKGTTVTLFWPI